MTTKTKWLFCGGVSGTRGCVLEMQSKVDGLSFWSGMMVLSCASRSELDHFWACHIYALRAKLFTRANTSNLTRTYKTHCKTGIKLYGIYNMPKMENLCFWLITIILVKLEIHHTQKS